MGILILGLEAADNNLGQTHSLHDKTAQQQMKAEIIVKLLTHLNYYLFYI